MSSLYYVTVINKGLKWVDLEAKINHIDVDNFPETTIFALRLLTSPLGDPYDLIYSAYENPESPLDDVAIPFEDELDELSDEDLEQYVAKLSIEKVVIYRACNMKNPIEQIHEKINEKCMAQGLINESEEWCEAWQRYYDEAIRDPNGCWPTTKFRI